MTTGTVLVQDALRRIGAHSTAAPADATSEVLGVRILNSMMELWLSKGIQVGFTPLDVPGDDLDETADSYNAIVDNLAIRLVPDFTTGSDVKPQLRIEAAKGFADIKAQYQQLTIPQKVPSSTLMLGAGSRRGSRRKTFFGKDETLGE